MDRNKSHGGSRSGKAKIGVPLQGSEFYTLGTKASSSRDDKNKVMSSVVKGVSSVSDRKREAVSALGTLSKKPKIGSSTSNVGSVPRLSGEGSSSSNSIMEPWEQMASDCDPADLVDSILSAIDQQDSDTVVSLLCGAIKFLASRSKTDPVLTLGLVYLAKVRPTLFCNDIVTSALISILRRDSQFAFKSRSNSNALVTACNLLARGYHDKKSWPEMFLRTYIDDAANERVWCDSEYCAPFVENICSAFGTRAPPKSMLQPELSAVAASGGGGRETMDDDSGDNSLQGDSLKSGDLKLDCAIQNRYASSMHIVENYVLDAIKEQLNRRQQQDCYTKNFLKFLSTTSGFAEVRALSISRLELWIHNGKLMKPAQELLTYICYNITGQTVKDTEVLATMVKMRLKNKPMINIFMSCLKEMITLQPNVLYISLKLVVQNELSNARNPNNMGMLGTMFQAKPEQSAQHLAEIYQEFLMQRDDCLRTLRVFLRELAKMLRFDISLLEFSKRFLTCSPALAAQIQQSEFKDRIFLSMVDISCLCMFLTVSPQVREANVSLRAGRHMKNHPILLNFYAQMSQLQLDALKWMFEVVPATYHPQPTDYNQALHKILLLDTPDQYSKCDQWPPEPERVALLRMVSETPVREDSLTRIILMGLTANIPFSVGDAMEVIEQTIKRASALRNMDYPVVEVNKIDTIDYIFMMAEYNPPESFKLPENYEPPKLAVRIYYWKAWTIMLLISAYNPHAFGAFCWETYPTMKVLMELCITNQFHDVKIEEDLQMVKLERAEIIEYESYLAAQASQTIITEENAVLTGQLIRMQPMGPIRRIPNEVMEHIQHLNSTMKLGHLLCRSRKPDLLLDIIQRHGTSQSMPWLSDLVQNSDGDFNHLPVQCLCEFLLSNSTTLNIENSRDAKLLNYLRNLLQDPASDKQTVCEVLEYFFRRLASIVKQSRIAALVGLKLLLRIFSPADEEEEWLLHSLPQVPHFIYARPLVILQLRSACQIENNPELVMIYIQFIAAHTLHDSVPEMLDHVMDMAQLIVERNTMFQHIIPIQPDSPLHGQVDDALDDSRLQTLNCLFVMFNNYIIKLPEHKEPYEWGDYPDLLSVHFEDGSQLPIHLNIIHAFIILLTHSSLTLPESIPILDYWFPPGRSIPQAFLPDTNEPVQLLPDWLKLKMIRSPVDRLVEAAMYELTPDQIVLFVQNFGTPISSMSKLLALLDHAVIEQFDAVKNAILNKAYLAQLIEIQQARGAKNGHITVHALELHSHSQTVPDPPKTVVSVLESVNLDQFESIVSNEKMPTAKTGTKEIEELVELVLKSPNLNKLNSFRFRKLVHQLVGRDGSKSLTQNGQTGQKVLAHLTRIAESQHGANFFKHIFQKSHACTFFRALLIHVSPKQDNYNYMMQTVGKIINAIPAEHSVVLQILLQKQKTFAIKQTMASRPTYTDKQDFLTILQCANVAQLESRGRKFVNDMVEYKKPESLVDAIVSILKFSEKVETDGERFIDKKGILVDWLAEVDSELITVDKNLQIDLMFGRNQNEYRFYLLSLLCHQANWKTLYNTVNYLLEQYRNTFDCNSVLNFIEALILNPKLWQGRDKAVSKHEQVELVICLNSNQINVFVEYVLNEGCMEIEANGPESYDENLNSRVNLLLKTVDEDKFRVEALMDFVLAYDCIDTLKLKFLQQLYLLIPPIKFICTELDNVFSANVQNLKGCRADKIVNYLITTLGSLKNKKDYDALSAHTELLMRKLAASHPTLFLRQLGVLAALLQGNAHMNLNVLRGEFHLSRYIQVIRLFSLLQPLLFDDAYKNGLQTALDCYFAYFKHHSRSKEYHLLIKFVELLQAYINKNPVSALAYIEQYTGLLQELADKSHHLLPLHQLVQGLSLLKHKPSKSELSDDEVKQEIDLEEKEKEDRKPTIAMDTDDSSSGAQTQLDIESRGAASFALGGPMSKQWQMSPHFLNLVNIVQHSSAEDVIVAPLLEIENLTTKRDGFLETLFNRLLQLIFSPSTLVRTNAYTLLIRHLKHQPGNSDMNKSAFNAYIQCLRDSNSTVAVSAVDNLVEMGILLQEFVPEILRVAFDLGIQSQLSTCTQIKKCVQTLKLQHGC